MRILLFIAVSALWVNAPVFGQIQTAWSRFYNTPQEDRPVALVRDSANNALVLVNSDGAAALVKYSPSGSALWTNHFDSPRQDNARALTVAPDDSIGVALVSSEGSSPGDFTLYKIAPNGSILWSREGDVTDVLPNNRLDLTTDADGNLLAAALTEDQIVFLKYDASGIPQWSNSYSVQAGYIATPKFFGTDAAGNAVLVSGLINIQRDQMLIVRVSPSGALTSTAKEWSNRNDFLTAAALDSDGNVYVTAGVISDKGLYHLLTAKYDSEGEPVWSNTRPPSSGFYHVVSAYLALDSTGRAIVTAYETRPVSEDEDEYQTLTLAYDAAGAFQWSARAQGWDRRPTGLSVDRDDNVHVVSGDSVGQTTLLVKYRPNGSQAAEMLAPGHSPGYIVTGAPGEFYVSFDTGAETRKFVHLESQPPLIATIQPGSVEVLPGSSVTFSAVVSGAGPFTYDWRYLGYRTGGTNATFTVSDAQFQWRSHGPYTVIVSNAAGYTISPEAHLTVLRPPTVHLTPATLRSVAGERATFTTITSGTEPISFFWFRNGQPIPGASDSSLEFFSVHPADAGYYSVMASNRAGTAMSGPSALQLVLPPKLYSNNLPIDFGTNSTASAYPAELVVSGVTGPVVKMTALLRGLSTIAPGELVVLLESPDGTSLPLLANDAEDATAEGVTLVFDDDAPGYVSDEWLLNGTFRPSQYQAPSLPPPAPLEPRVTRLEALTKGRINGAWRLFVAEPYWTPSFGIPGRIAGWSLAFQEANPDAVLSTAFTRISRQGGEILIEWEGFPGWKLQRSRSLVQPEWTDVPDTLGASRIQLPMDAAGEFFRLTK